MVISLLAMVMAVIEPSSGLEVTVPTELPCIYIPSDALDDGCPEVPQETIDGFKKSGVWLYAIDPQTGSVLTGMVIAHDGSSMSETALNQFVAGTASGMKKGGTFTPIARGENTFVLTSHNDVRMAEFGFSADLETQKVHPAMTVVEMALIPTEATLITISTYTRERDGLLASALAGIKSTKRNFQGTVAPFGQGIAYRIGQVIGAFFCLCVLPLLAVGGLVLLLRKSALKQAEALRSPK